MNKKNILMFVSIFGFLAIYIFRKKIFGGKIQNNFSKLTIFYKPEEDPTNDPNGKALLLMPNQTPNERVDGITFPSLKNGLVYKIPDGCIVNILENNEIEIVYCPTESISKWNGWQSETFLNYLHSINDNTWNKLFEKSKGL
ncbi:MAG TPA: hypothetical protein PK079_21625 [Leptospiraceae bacterium]|nr:hypothetical protein [Leptospiraceae bacterium]HMW08103.1 hypothetical protein [Leptospiraceae bacterium]HMY33814.1 hypothetical protein [Leptospiraceae bacterium]HMZ65925.1 hypothetical protein [Leptospiraceae bacterium]HNA08853.1 hypothetical protein [Leptospiraceae bacterium]